MQFLYIIQPPNTLTCLISVLTCLAKQMQSPSCLFRGVGMRSEGEKPDQKGRANSRAGLLTYIELF